MARTPEVPTRQSGLRAISEFLVVGVCTLAFALNAAGIGATLLTPNFAGQRDFVTYWSSGHQMVQRANPYDGPAILRMEHSVGFRHRPSPAHHAQCAAVAAHGTSAGLPEYSRCLTVVVAADGRCTVDLGTHHRGHA